MSKARQMPANSRVTALMVEVSGLDISGLLGSSVSHSQAELGIWEPRVETKSVVIDLLDGILFFLELGDLDP